MKRNLWLSSLLFMIMTVTTMAQNPSSGFASGQDTLQNPITTAVPFLRIAPDARAAALGDAGVASSPDANSIHWNPAKLAFIDKKAGGSFSYTPWLPNLGINDMYIAYLTGFYKLSDRETIASSFRYFDLGSITFTDGSGNPYKDFQPNELALDVTYSRLISERWSAAVAARYIYSNLAGNFSGNAGATDIVPAHSGAVDVSAFYTNDDIMLGGTLPSTFNFGANISNIGPKITYSGDNQQDYIPTNLALGVNLKSELDAFNTLALMMDFNKLLVPTPDPSNPNKYNEASVVEGIASSLTEAPGGFEEKAKEIMISTGLEYWYNDIFAARLGYFYEHAQKGGRNYVTMGAGLKYQKFIIDFSYLLTTQQAHPLDNTLRFSLAMVFDDFQSGGSAPDKL